MVLDLDLETLFDLDAWAGGLGSFTPSIATFEGRALIFKRDEERNN